MSSQDSKMSYLFPFSQSKDCPDFKKLGVNQRAKSAMEKNSCFRRWSLTAHRTRQCNLRRSCGVDNYLKHHHPLIHGAEPVFVRAAVVGFSIPVVSLQIVSIVMHIAPHCSIVMHIVHSSHCYAHCLLKETMCIPTPY